MTRPEHGSLDGTSHYILDKDKKGNIIAELEIYPTSDLREIRDFVLLTASLFCHKRL